MLPLLSSFALSCESLHGCVTLSTDLTFAGTLSPASLRNHQHGCLDSFRKLRLRTDQARETRALSRRFRLLAVGAGAVAEVPTRW